MARPPKYTAEEAAQAAYQCKLKWNAEHYTKSTLLFPIDDEEEGARSAERL